MYASRAVEIPTRPRAGQFLWPACMGLIVAGAASCLARASADEPPDRPVDLKEKEALLLKLKQKEAVLQRARDRNAELIERIRLPAAAAPAALRQEGKVLIGKTNMLVDGIRIGIDLSRLEEPPADAEQDPDAPPEPWQQVQIEEGAFDRVLFIGNGMMPLGKLEELLDQEMKLVESVRPLELDQRRKLRLAARGDMHRILQEIDDLRPKFDQTWTAPESESRRPIMEVSALMKEATRVRNLLVTEAFRADSRFDKNLRRMVTEAEYVMILDKRNQTPPAPRIRKVFKAGSGR